MLSSLIVDCCRTSSPNSDRRASAWANFPTFDSLTNINCGSCMTSAGSCIRYSSPAAAPSCGGAEAVPGYLAVAPGCSGAETVPGYPTVAPGCGRGEAVPGYPTVAPGYGRAEAVPGILQWLPAAVVLKQFQGILQWLPATVVLKQFQVSCSGSRLRSC